MALAARVHVVEHGDDPRRYALIAFGGAGPCMRGASPDPETCDRDHPPAAA
jgi:hypothetical protein